MHARTLLCLSLALAASGLPLQMALGADLRFDPAAACQAATQDQPSPSGKRPDPGGLPSLRSTAPPTGGAPSPAPRPAPPPPASAPDASKQPQPKPSEQPR
jgi:hypothetical protein